MCPKALVVWVSTNVKRMKNILTARDKNVNRLKRLQAVSFFEKRKCPEQGCTVALRRIKAVWGHLRSGGESWKMIFAKKKENTTAKTRERKTDLFAFFGFVRGSLLFLHPSTTSG
jgi:hypothetical protein